MEGSAQDLEADSRRDDPGAGARLRPFSFWREELKRAWCDIRGGELSSARVAASVAMGAFVGCLPLFGLHLAIVLFLSLRLRLDGAIAYIAANISNPFFAPFLIALEVQAGAFVVEGHVPEIGREVALDSALALFPKYLAVGAPIVATAAAASLGAAAWALTISKRRLVGPGSRPVYALPPNAPPWVVAAERVAARYAAPEDRSASTQTHFHYVRIKLVMDPVAQMIASVAGGTPGALGEVVDVGTGRGQLPILLVVAGRATRARGFDWDEAKIEEGKRAAAKSPALDVDLSCGDAREAEIGEADTVLLVDVVHYFAIEEQDSILRRAARAVRPGGRVIVREADTERGWRSWATLLEEKVFTWLRFNRGERVKFRPAREIAGVLEEEGLTVTVRPAWGKTPFSNVLVVGDRPPGQPAR
jgi:2-polyprenyl-3-methyl-5-hydroxy-6-metoxy-1,4-benzoquinol methylase